MSDPCRPLTFDLYWSMRSPFCYLVLDRVLDLIERFDVEGRLRIVYPIAIRNPGFFDTAPAHYRPYHIRDAARIAAYYGIPYRRPVPDPIVQDLASGRIAAEQPHIHRLTRLAAAAAERGQGFAFLDHVMRLLWDGQTDDWDQTYHLGNAMHRAGLDPEALELDAYERSEHYDTAIAANQAAQIKAGHSGVPLFVFEGEPFFGQDRFDLLVWRMRQKGLAEKAPISR